MDLTFKQIYDGESKEFKNIVELYEASFSSDSRREIVNKKKLLSKENYGLFYITEKKKFIGFLIEWKLPEFYFIEHFAVREDLRGKGYGSEIIKFFIENKKVILETEPSANGETAQKKIAFYEKLGFKMNIYKYIQPAYEKHKNPVEYVLMSYPEYINNKVKFMVVEEQLHEMVYEFVKRKG